MIARPTLVVIALAGAGAGLLKLTEASLPSSRFSPALVGAGCAFFATAVLLSDLPKAQRQSLSIGAGVLGFFMSFAASGFFAHPRPVGFAAAFVPTFLLFLAGFGRERLTLELARLENEIDDRATRPAAMARAIEIRDKHRADAEKTDPSKKIAPPHFGDPRGVYAYAAQVVAYGHALEGRYADAVESLDAVPLLWMPGPMRLLMLSNIAFWQLCAGKLEDAKKTVAKADEKDGLPEARPNLRATRALIHVLAEDPDKALEIVGVEVGSEPDRLGPRYAIIRAHALFAKGDKDKARAELERALEEELGAEEFRRILPAGGPANALLEEVMRDGPKRASKPEKEAEKASPQAT